VQFEFDPAKSLANLAKHGIDFEQAQALWQDQDYLEIPARTQDEPRRRRTVKARDLDEAFNEGTDITSHLDLTAARRPKRDVQRVNVDFPAWMVSTLDAEAARLGITRQAVIKTWIAERIDERVS
jgi:uncharacterized DUF497 family protein